MDYKKTNAPTNTVTRNLMELCEDTGNIYETVSIIGKRANQIAAEMKMDLTGYQIIDEPDLVQASLKAVKLAHDGEVDKIGRAHV